jgi:hypothetical protein
MPWAGPNNGNIGPRHYNLGCITLHMPGQETDGNDDDNDNDITAIDGNALLRISLDALPSSRLKLAYFRVN